MNRVSPVVASVLPVFLGQQVSAGIRRLLTPSARLWHAFGTLPIAICLSSMPRVSETEAWIKPFRRQVAITCGEGWYVRNNRGRMRLNVPGHGSLSLNYDWSERGATQALPYIQQLFKRWDGGRVSLGAAATRTNTSNSYHQTPCISKTSGALSSSALGLNLSIARKSDVQRGDLKATRPSHRGIHRGRPW